MSQDSHTGGRPLPLVLLAMLTLLLGLWAALARIGWDLPIFQPSMLNAHGPLMISGFLGSLVTLERAVALGRRWMYAGPLLTALGALATMLGFVPLGPLAILLGSGVALAIHLVMVRRQPALYTLTMLAGAVTWLGGNVLWLAGWPIFRFVLWWAAFLVLTIAGERLELSRVLKPARPTIVQFIVTVGILIGGLLLMLVAFDLGVRVASLGLLALAGWLLAHDIARRTIRRSGLTRYIAACLLFGYLWLTVAAIVGLAVGGVFAGVLYDALLHTIFLGFVFSMIFGHAPIILPAVLGIALPYRPGFYAHLIMLHGSLVLRIASDLAAWPPGRMWGGLLNAVAVLLFIASTASLIFANRVGKLAVRRAN
jgi:hypothetical protein